MKRWIELRYRRLFYQWVGIPWIPRRTRNCRKRLREQALMLYRGGYHRAAALTARVALEIRLKHKARCAIESWPGAVKRPRSALEAIWFLSRNQVITNDQARAYRRVYRMLSKSAHGFNLPRETIGELVYEVDAMCAELLAMTIPAPPPYYPAEPLGPFLAGEVGVA